MVLFTMIYASITSFSQDKKKNFTNVQINIMSMSKAINNIFFILKSK